MPEPLDTSLGVANKLTPLSLFSCPQLVVPEPLDIGLGLSLIWYSPHTHCRIDTSVLTPHPHPNPPLLPLLFCIPPYCAPISPEPADRGLVVVGDRTFFFFYTRSFRPKPSCKARWKGEDKADRGRGGKTSPGNGQAWSSPSPGGQWRTGENGGIMEVAKSSVVPQRPSRLRNRWWRWWC